jgi:type IV pilus assembly protein PilX
VRTPPPHTQNGSALIIGLIFLVMLTVIGITSMQSTTLEEKMAGNQRDRSVAFQAAETALRDGEAYLLATTSPAFVTACTGGLCSVGNTPNVTTYTWSDGNYIAYGVSPSPAASITPLPQIPNVSQQPRYFIVDLGANTVPLSGCSGGSAHGYRIIARGWGQNINTQVTLDTVYAKC